MMCWLYAGIALLALAWLARWLLRPDAVPTVRAPPSGTDYTQRPGLSGMMPLYAPVTGKRYLVVGGSGSVGLRILEALVERGEKHVTSYDVAPPRRRLAGATFLLGDVTDYAAVRAACENVDVVFATFALIRPHERLSCLYAQSHAVNVVGTENVVRACVEAEVGVLVQTSTSNVCVSPSLVKPVMDENSPFVDPSNTANHYQRGWVGRVSDSFYPTLLSFVRAGGRKHRRTVASLGTCRDMRNRYYRLGFRRRRGVGAFALRAPFARGASTCWRAGLLCVPRRARLVRANSRLHEILLREDDFPANGSQASAIAVRECAWGRSRICNVGERKVAPRRYWEAQPCDPGHLPSLLCVLS
mmetsp:Transcript_29303/g.67219  ORF Transcript_29303/g.67219 Transcript_29303/m.67219 type:complete len:358 (-) Transcript_29303:257-1330(-)